MTADTTRPVRPRPAPADDDASDAEDLAGEASRPRYTMWAGGIAALALVALALWGGAHLSVLVPGMRPAWLAGIVGVCLAWLVVAVLGWCAAELLKTHHRAMRAAAWRGTRRGARWAWVTGRHHGGRAVMWAGGRWQQRSGGGGPPSMFGRLLAALTGGEDDGEPCPSCCAPAGQPCAAECGSGRGRPLPTEEIAALDQAEPCPECHAAAGEPCAAGCRGGYPAGPEPAPEPASADQAGRTVYMTRVRLAAGGTETPQ